MQIFNSVLSVTGQAPGTLTTPLGLFSSVCRVGCFALYLWLPIGSEQHIVCTLESPFKIVLWGFALYYVEADVYTDSLGACGILSPCLEISDTTRNSSSFMRLVTGRSFSKWLLKWLERKQLWIKPDNVRCQSRWCSKKQPCHIRSEFYRSVI